MNKKTYRINISIAILFFLGITISAYLLFRIPFSLRVPVGSETFLTWLYVIVALTFVAGGVAIILAMQYKEELIVYRERTQEMKDADDAAEQKKNEISLDTIKSAISSANSPEGILQNGLNALCKQIGAGQGAAYLIREQDGKRIVELTNGFALSLGEGNHPRFDLGEGIIGQAAESGQMLYLDEIPDGYIKIISGLGSASPRYVMVNPLKSKQGVIGVLEIAAFAALDKEQKKFLEQGAELIAEQLSNQKG